MLTRRGSANQLWFLLVPSFAAHSHNWSKLSVGGEGAHSGMQGTVPWVLYKGSGREGSDASTPGSSVEVRWVPGLPARSG